jgi:hypothetical protein
MSAHANPDIVGDGLVFLYDTDDGKSYKGEPTENIFLNPTFIGTAGTQTSTVTDNWYFSGYTGASGFKFYNNSTSPIPLKFANEGAVITTAASPDNQNRRFYCDEVLEVGATYAVSAWIYTTRTSGISIAHFEYGGATLNTGYFSSTSTHPNHAVGEWYYWEDTYTVGADYTSGLIGPVHTGSSDTIVGIQRFQIEKKSHATPFVNGTRSATQGLIDRTGTSTINISNASFDSNAQMTFDGTDDYLDCGDMGISSSKVTFAAWIKFSGSSTEHIIDASGNTCHLAILSGNKPYFYNGSTYHTGADTITNGVWYYLTGVQSDTNDIYINGVLSNSINSNVNISVSTVNIGRWQSGGRYFNGDIASARIYNRALTAAEVLRNFNATKSRFGL